VTPKILALSPKVHALEIANPAFSLKVHAVEIADAALSLKMRRGWAW
jgi:hypothetical protein